MTQYNIMIEMFEPEYRCHLKINGSHWTKNQWPMIKNDDVILVLGKTRNIEFVFSSEMSPHRGYSSDKIYFRPSRHEMPSDSELMIVVDRSR